MSHIRFLPFSFPFPYFQLPSSLLWASPIFPLPPLPALTPIVLNPQNKRNCFKHRSYDVTALPWTKNETQTPYLACMILLLSAMLSSSPITIIHQASTTLAIFHLLSKPGSFPPQGLCTYYYLHQDCLFSNSTHDFLCLLYSFHLKSPLVWPLYLKELLVLAPDNISYYLIVFFFFF